YAYDILSQSIPSRLSSDLFRLYARRPASLASVSASMQLQARCRGAELVADHHQRGADDAVQRDLVHAIERDVEHARQPAFEHDRSEEHTSELQSRENLVCR